MKRLPRIRVTTLTFRLVAATVLAALAIGGGIAACSSGDDCANGVVINGKCEGKCTEAACNANGVTNNICVDNRCALKCTSHRDCRQDGTQDCAPAVDSASGPVLDSMGKPVDTCQSNGHPAGFGVPCPFGSECDAFEGFTCLTRGTADADAYCTRYDCKDDKDCPGGYTCTIVKDDPSRLCGMKPAHTSPVQVCPTSNETCVKAGEGGNTYQEGSYCTYRNACIKRSPCTTCKTDLDCSLATDERCVQVGQDMRCVARCNSDCADGFECSNDGYCRPKFGQCAGTGKFCEPCITDLDCGGAGSLTACAQVDSLTHEHACFDESFSTSCMTSADCPKSPSGKNGTCLDESVFVDPSDPRYHKCSFPIGTMHRSCW